MIPESFLIVFFLCLVVMSMHSLVMLIVRWKDTEKRNIYFVTISVSFVLLLLMYIFGHMNKNTQSPVENGQQTKNLTPTPAPTPIKSHNYDMEDGARYGYTAALSQQDINSGKVANNVVMFGYAGKRDGKYQVHVIERGEVSAIECSLPCEYAKVITVKNSYDDQITDSRNLRTSPDMLAYLALQDAINGKLRTYVQVKKSGRYSVWIDERKGIVLTKEKITPPQPAL